MNRSEAVVGGSEADSRTDVHTYRRTDGQTYRLTDVQTYRRTDLQTYRRRRACCSKDEVNDAKRIERFLTIWTKSDK